MAVRAERMEIYDHQEPFEKTVTEHFLPEYLRQAPWAEFVESRFNSPADEQADQVPRPRDAALEVRGGGGRRVQEGLGLPHFEEGSPPPPAFAPAVTRRAGIRACV
jgi:hypothetical protein